MPAAIRVRCSLAASTSSFLPTPSKVDSRPSRLPFPQHQTHKHASSKLKSASVLSWPALGLLLQIHPLQPGQRACHQVQPRPKAPRQNPPTPFHPSFLCASLDKSSMLEFHLFALFPLHYTPCLCGACCLVVASSIGLVFPIGRNGRDRQV